MLIPNPAQVGLEFDEQRRMAVEREVDGGDGLPESLKFGGVSGVVGRRSGKGAEPRHRPRKERGDDGQCGLPKQKGVSPFGLTPLQSEEDHFRFRS